MASIEENKRFRHLQKSLFQNLSGTGCCEQVTFLCSVEAIPLPRLTQVSAVTRIAVKNGRSFSGHPGAVLDGCEHGGIIIAAGAARLRNRREHEHEQRASAAALGVATPWHVRDVAFDAGKRLLTIAIDFAKAAGSLRRNGRTRSVRDTQTKRYRHLNFFQRECYLEVRTPRIKLPMAGWFSSNPIGRASFRGSRCSPKP